MNGIVINIDPTIFRLGHFMLNWYGIIVILAIIAATAISLREGKRKGISSEVIYSMAPWVLIGGIVGARLFHVIDRWDYYAGNPAQIFFVWQGGLAIWGALAGGALGVLIYTKIKHLGLGRLTDALVPGFLVGQIIGRFACIIDGDAVGSATTLPWAFTYINPNAMVPSGLLGVPVHPYPVYDQLWNLVGLAVALKLRRHLKTDGLLFLIYLSIYAVGRFVLTFVRQEKIWFWGLQEAQIIALFIFFVSLAAIVYTARMRRAQVESVIINDE